MRRHPRPVNRQAPCGRPAARRTSRRWTPTRPTRLLVARLGLHDGRALRRWLADRILDRGLMATEPESR